MSTDRRNSHIQFRYGQCLNDGCSKCKSKEIQKIPARKDFVCEECGKELREVHPQPTWWEKYGKITMAAVGAAVVIGGGVALFNMSGSDKSESKQEAVLADTTSTTTVNPDTVPAPVAETPTPESDGKGNKPEEQTSAPVDVSNTPTTKPAAPAKPAPAVANGSKLKCGKYEGPMSGGKPHGVGGTITVTRSYTIDLKDGSGNTVSVESGDRISNTKFKNGVLQQGQLIRSNGERKFLSGLSERL